MHSQMTTPAFYPTQRSPVALRQAANLFPRQTDDSRNHGHERGRDADAWMTIRNPPPKTRWSKLTCDTLSDTHTQCLFEKARFGNFEDATHRQKQPRSPYVLCRVPLASASTPSTFTIAGIHLINRSLMAACCACCLMPPATSFASARARSRRCECGGKKAART
jgi:hypothetical protein